MPAIEELVSNANIPPGWIKTSSNSCFCQISHLESGSHPAFVNVSLLIKNDTTWQLHVHSHPVSPENPSIAGFPIHLNSVTTSTLFSRLSTLHICPGNPESKFISLTSMKKSGEFLSNENKWWHTSIKMAQ